MDDFGRGLGCLIHGLLAVAVAGFVVSGVLGGLILAGVL